MRQEIVPGSLAIATPRQLNWDDTISPVNGTGSAVFSDRIEASAKIVSAPITGVASAILDVSLSASASAEAYAPGEPHGPPSVEIRRSPLEHLNRELARVNEAITANLQVVDACEQTFSAMRAYQASHDLALASWNALDARERPSRPPVPQPLRDAQERYVTLRHQAEDARSNLVHLRQRDASLRQQLQTVAQEESRREAEAVLGQFRTLCKATEAACDHVGREVRRLRGQHPDLHGQLIQLVDELRGRMW